MKSQRTIITISDEDKFWLENYNKAHDISMADAVQRGIMQLKERDTGEAYRRLVLKTRAYGRLKTALEIRKNFPLF